MNVIGLIRGYVNKMIEESGAGMKVLLMDKETVSIVSLVYSQSEILQKEVFLFELLDNEGFRDQMKHMKCIVFVRPTHRNIELLTSELHRPIYGAYYLYFSNIISKENVRNLANADEQEVVKEVQECYADYLAIAPHLFSLNLSRSCKGLSWDKVVFERTLQGLLAVLLTLKKKPQIRFQKSSKMAQLLAEGIKNKMVQEEALFDFRKTDAMPLLLILDRREDAVTPLLNQWTYQAMVHELLTINNNRVNLSHVQGISKDLKEVIMSPNQDEFYAETMYSNFGEIGAKAKELMNEFQQSAKSKQKLESIADMKAFVDEYPQFKKMSGTITKHLTIMGELSKVCKERNLFEVSEAEQEIVCQQGHSQHLQKIRSLLSKKAVAPLDCLRLVLLYALRYEKHANNDIAGLVNMLKSRDTSENYIKLVDWTMDYGGVGARTNADFFGDKPSVKFTKKFLRGFSDIENIFTQHVPYISELLDEVIRGRLSLTFYPCVEPYSAVPPRVEEIILFIIGGVTYEESLAVLSIMRGNPNIRILLGGSNVLNTKMFLEEIDSAIDGVPRRKRRHY